VHLVFRRHKEGAIDLTQIEKSNGAFVRVRGRFAIQGTADAVGIELPLFHSLAPGVSEGYALGRKTLREVLR
jgi:hypothetical protein